MIKNITTTGKIMYQIVSITLVLIILLLLTNFSWWAIFSTLFSLYILNSLLLDLGEGMPINLIIVFIACMQWLMGPVISYYAGINHPFYGMQVSESVYFSLALPGVLCYHLGLLLPIWNIKYKTKEIIAKLDLEVEGKTKAAYYLIGIGFFASFVSSFAPGVLFFFLYLLSQLKFVGSFYLYLSKSRNKIILFLVAGSLVISSLASALFHDLILWGIFFLFVYAIKNRISLTKRVSFLIIGFFMVFLLQSVKYQYRSITWTSSSLNTFDKATVFFSMVSENIWSPDKLFDPKKNELAVTRLNQGWIITRVMNYVPFAQPFAQGETIEEAFRAALLPRFLSENKAIAGGRYNMERFTGIILQEGTSMNISLLGEGYGNYGRDGAILFLFLIGLLYGFILRYILANCIMYPTYIFWMPFIFLQVIKAETDLTTTLNYLTKASIVMILILFVMRKLLNLKP